MTSANKLHPATELQLQEGLIQAQVSHLIFFSKDLVIKPSDSTFGKIFSLSGLQWDIRGKVWQRKCPFCSKILNNRNMFEKHMHRHTKPVNELQCDVCKDGYVFSQVSSLNKHKQKKHRDQWVAQHGPIKRRPM